MVVTTIHRAKTNLSGLIERAERGEEVVIARGKQPVVKLVPVRKAPKKRPRRKDKKRAKVRYNDVEGLEYPI